MIHRGTKLFLSAIVLISALMMLVNLAPSIDFVGRAFYISDGKAGMAEPGAVMNINTVFWGLVLILILAYISAMHFTGLKDFIPRIKK